MIRNLVLTSLFALLTVVLHSQSFDKAKLETYFDQLEKHDKFMGSIAVSQNGSLLYTRSVGFANVNAQTKANENSIYRIGSISKTFTALLTLIAVEEGKLDLNQSIIKFFPGISYADSITISHLLYHRSGIHSFTDNKDYLSWNTQPKSKDELLEIIIKGGSDFHPDTRSRYSNSNYVLLTFILEESFGKSYASLVEEYIARPLGLENTRLGEKIKSENNECLSYKFSDGWEPVPETDMSIPLGAGAMVSTPSDLVKFSDALFVGKIVGKESLEQMKTINDQFGMGMVKVPFYDLTGYGHTGGIDEFSSVFTWFAEGNISYAMVSNGTRMNNNDISIAVLSAVYDKAYKAPEYKTYTVRPEDMNQYPGKYSSAEIPLKITVFTEKNTLMAQATGQSAIPLTPFAKHQFVFEVAGIEMEFNPDEKAMVLRQGGQVFQFIKE